jgi:hypothetical protein
MPSKDEKYLLKNNKQCLKPNLGFVDLPKLWWPITIELLILYNG